MDVPLGEHCHSMPSASVAPDDRGGVYDLSDEVHLSCRNHVTDARDIIEHPDAFFLDSCDRDMKDLADAAMEEDFKLVDKSFAHGPGFASP